jgi:anti-sigma regulatory factor (Ser/Thr protein kinase)
MLSQELEQKTQRIQKELDLAREFHRRLLPLEPPHVRGLSITPHHVPSAKVGGEVYDAFNMGNSCVGLFIGDVSGHGLPAALVGTIAKLTLHTYAVNEYSPRAILEYVNRELCRNTVRSQFMTAFFCVLDLETDRLKYVNATHCPPILVGEDRFDLLDTEGMFCGMFEDPKYEEKQVQLEPGDRLVFYSDGVTKLLNAEGQSFTVDRLHDCVRANGGRTAADIVAAVVQELRRHLGGSEAEDDITLLGVELLPREAKENRVVVPSEPKLLPRIEDAIQAKLQEYNYGERALFAVRLAVEEAIINAMKHGNRMDKAKTVTVVWSVDDKQAVIAVEDQGEGFDPEAVPDPTAEENLDIPHGRGLVLMRAYMDDVKFNRRGNRVTLIKRAPWSK